MVPATPLALNFSFRFESMQDDQYFPWEIAPVVHQTAQTLSARAKYAIDLDQDKYRTKRRTNRQKYEITLPSQFKRQRRPVDPFDPKDRQLFVEKERLERTDRLRLSDTISKKHEDLHEPCRNYLRLQKELVNLKRQNCELQQSLLHKSNIIHELQSQLRLKDHTIRESQCGKNGIQAEVKVLQKQLMEFERKIDNQQVFKEISSLQQQLQALQIQNQSLRKQHLVKPLDVAPQSGQKLSEQNSGLKKAVQQLRVKVKNEMDLNRKAKSQIVLLKEQKLKLLKILQDLQSQVESFRRKVQVSAESEVSELTNSQAEDDPHSEQPKGLQNLVRQLAQIRELNKQVFIQIQQLK